MASFSYLENHIEIWGQNKGIIGPGSTGTPMGQAIKTLEEVNELIEAIKWNDREGTLDAIGDIVVTLIMQCSLQNIPLTECLQKAYDIISKRNGKMVDGVFVKEA